MLKTKTRLISTLAALVFLTGSSIAAAHVNFDVNIGITAPPPPPRNIIVAGPPQGYRTCYMTQGMWYGDVWVPAHQQCEYVGADGPSVWVSGYWGCINVGPGGRCGQWRWYNRHVERGNVAYGRPHYNHGYPGGQAYVHTEYQQGPHYTSSRFTEYQHGPAVYVGQEDHPHNGNEPHYVHGSY